ncbi:hypothetical protein [Candidatus Leptofilum sp.]|uniref:hypothetical protein n=1 Tax=Candidatus Leptofilum sp. TaxID=3241576 RepID=UPI003B5BB460
MLTPDSIVPNPANPQSYNRFSYAYNNPINYSDPSGHYAVCFQQGRATDDEVTALSQICQELADSGAFGASGVYEVFENTEDGAIEALEWLAMMLGEGGELYGVDEPFVLVGFSWGGGAALEFAKLLDGRINITIDALVTIDPVLSGREEFGREFVDIQNVTIPENVDSAYNIYATEDAFGILRPFDQGEQNIEGALNVAMADTNHCTIAYESCGGIVPQQESSDSPINQTTLSYVKTWLDFLSFSGEW